MNWLLTIRRSENLCVDGNKRNYCDPEVNDGNFYCDTADLLIFPAIIVRPFPIVSRHDRKRSPQNVVAICFLGESSQNYRELTVTIGNNYRISQLFLGWP